MWRIDLTWYRIEHGRLLVGRRQRLSWRSLGRFASARGESVGAVTLSRTRLAFTAGIMAGGGNVFDAALGRTP